MKNQTGTRAKTVTPVAFGFQKALKHIKLLSPVEAVTYFAFTDKTISHKQNRKYLNH